MLSHKYKFMSVTWQLMEGGHWVVQTGFTDFSILLTNSSGYMSFLSEFVVMAMLWAVKDASGMMVEK
jgi:hypothetical protein